MRTVPSSSRVKRAAPNALRSAPLAPSFPRRGERGFTLVELLIGATLGAIVMAGVLSSYIFIGRNLARLANQQSLESEGRRTLAYFARDVRLASGLTDTANLGASRFSLTVPTGTGSNIITYYYNSTPIDLVAGVYTDDVTVNGSTVTMRRESLTRCVYNGSTITSLILLRNIISGSLIYRYYDTSAKEYISATLTAGSYLAGIKQISLEFSTQTGNSDNGTQTKAYPVASNRLILRNRALLQ